MCSTPAPAASTTEPNAAGNRNSRPRSVRIPLLPRWTCGLCGGENPVAAPRCAICATPSALPDIAASCRQCTQSFVHLAAEVLTSLHAACERLDQALAASLDTALPTRGDRDGLPVVSPLTVHAGAAMLEQVDAGLVAIVKLMQAAGVWLWLCGCGCGCVRVCVCVCVCACVCVCDAPVVTLCASDRRVPSPCACLCTTHHHRLPQLPPRQTARASMHTLP